MAPVSPEFEKEVVQAVKALQKRKGVSTKKLIQHLVTFYGYERHKLLVSSVRRVLKKFVRRGVALREGMRYKFLKQSHICQCKGRRKKCQEVQKTEAPDKSSASSQG